MDSAVANITPSDGETRPWGAAWRHAIEESPVPALLIDLATNRTVAISCSAARLLALPCDGAVPELTMRPEEMGVIIQLAADRVLDGLESNKQFQRGDGSWVEFRSVGRAVRTPDGCDLAVCLLKDPEVDSLPTAAASDLQSAAEGEEAALSRLTVGVVGRRFHVTAADGEAAAQPTIIGAGLLELVHPNDAGTLLLALAGATTAPCATAFIRWRRLGQRVWPLSLVTVRLGDGATGPTFTLTALPVGARSPIAATDILAVLGDLPPRQLEVLTRLVDGERVQDIAQAMYLSESTIRNHLAAIFTKAGVHSQAQLLALLREHSRVTA